VAGGNVSLTPSGSLRTADLADPGWRMTTGAQDSVKMQQHAEDLAGQCHPWARVTMVSPETPCHRSQTDAEEGEPWDPFGRELTLVT
jgi:hypothetical protein